MATVTRLEVRIDTGASGTDGRVFLGIGGREFRLLRKGNDFRPNTQEEFFLGTSPNVLNPNDNSPSRDLPIDDDDLDLFPIYLRLEGGDARWDLNYVRVKAEFSGGDRTYRALFGSPSLALGSAFGRRVYLRKV